MREFNKCAEFPMCYDEIYDQFYAWDGGNEDFDFWKGKSYETEDGTKTLYAIGSGSWVWDAVNDRDLTNIAQKVEEFIFEFDTYECRDNYNDRIEVINKIKQQLKNCNILKQILIIIYNEDLTEEIKFEKLGGVLKL